MPINGYFIYPASGRFNNVGNTNIALTNITYTDGDSIKNLETTSLKVLVTKDANEGEEIPTNKENVIVEDTEIVTKTFSNMPLVITLGIFSLVGLIAILIINNKFKNNDNKKKKTIYSLIALEIALVLTTIILIWVSYNKTDVNKDGKKDYQDAQEIMEYLINIEGNKEETEEESNKENKKEETKVNENKNKPNNKYDVNNDGKVDIEDVGDTTEQIEKDTKVTLKEATEDDVYYEEKGKITLKFTADITPKEVKITKVKIDNKY